MRIKKRAFFYQPKKLRKAETYPFFKGPAFADFMFVVVEHFLSNLDHLVPHVLDLGHSLHKDTETEHMVKALEYAYPCDTPTWCQNC